MPTSGVVRFESAPRMGNVFPRMRKSEPAMISPEMNSQVSSVEIFAQVIEQFAAAAVLIMVDRDGQCNAA
jgi:hypothetical protein